MEIDKSTIGTLTDDQLFKALKSCNLPTGPITSTTRTIYERRLRNHLEGNSTLTKEKPQSKASTKIPVVETLTSNTIIEKTLVEPSNNKIQPSSNKIQHVAPTININIHNTNDSCIPKSETQLATRSKNTFEKPVTKFSSNIYESIQSQKQHTEQTPITISHSPKAPSKIAKSMNDFNFKQTSSTSSSLQRIESIKHVNGTSAKQNDFAAKTNENLIEKSTQRLSNLTDTYSHKAVEKSQDYHPIQTQTYQVSRSTIQSSVEASLKSSIENLGRQNSHSNYEVTSSSNRYETPSTHQQTASNKEPAPVLVPNRFTASPTINHRSSPLLRDKYAERLQNYGLLDSSPMTRISTSSSSTVPLALNYSTTPGTIRSRPAMHTPRPREPETTEAQMRNYSELSKTEVSPGRPTSTINYKYAILFFILTVIAYWIILGFEPASVKPPAITP